MRAGVNGLVGFRGIARFFLFVVVFPCADVGVVVVVVVGKNVENVAGK